MYFFVQVLTIFLLVYSYSHNFFFNSCAFFCHIICHLSHSWSAWVPWVDISFVSLDQLRHFQALDDADMDGDVAHYLWQNFMPKFVCQTYANDYEDDEYGEIMMNINKCW